MTLENIFCPSPSPQGGGGPGVSVSVSPSPLRGGIRGGGRFLQTFPVNPVPVAKAHTYAMDAGVNRTDIHMPKTPRNAADPKSKPGRLSSVTTAIRLLKAFSESEEEIGVSALAQRLGVAKSTVHRLAVTLVAEGLLEQNPETERYRLGIGLFGLGTLVRRRMDLSNEARPYLFDLRERTHETVLLGVPTDTEIMYVYNLESPHSLRMRSDIGVRRPGYCTAVGRAIFAFASEETVERLLAPPLAQRTPKTVTVPGALRSMLAEVRSRGYAIEDEESEPGIRCIAAPVRGAGGAVVGALGIAGPTQRLNLSALRALAAPLIEATAAISVRLGHRN
jgi:IclR family KDG regulon transcriptional repressor